MGTRKFLVWNAVLVGCASLLIAHCGPALREKSAAKVVPRFIHSNSETAVNRVAAADIDARPAYPTGGDAARRRAAQISIPLTLEENVGQVDPRIAFVGRGRGVTAFLTREGIEMVIGTRAGEKGIGAALRLNLTATPRRRRTRRRRRRGKYVWRGRRRLRTESNYFLGGDARLWRTHVPHFERAEAADVLPGVSVVAYGNDEGLEYDLQLAPGTDVSGLELQASGADAIRIDSEGNLLMRVGSKEIRMRKPAIYQHVGQNLPQKTQGAPRPDELKESHEIRSTQERRPVDGGYVLHVDGTIGFQLGPHDSGAALVLDPSLSVAYSTFLGGAGEDSANSIATDSMGNVYIGGTTTSVATFPETGSKRIGPSGGAAEFFIAKINPAASGLSSLVYLTFLGGSGNQAGGLIAVDSMGDVAVMGTTTSTDYPVTDGSQRTAGPNDAAVTEIGPAGATLVFSTLFGGSGTESAENPGGIALNASGDIFIASDTSSVDLTTTAGAYQTAYGGGGTDGFLAEFQPLVTPHLEYCTYLGINAVVGIGGVAVDAGDNAYVAGFTSDPGSSLSTLNGFQTVFGGPPSDGFLMKIRPSGTGASDLAYGTFLGGSGLDEILAVSVGVPMPATAYVTGTTQSQNFPTNGTLAGPQTTLKMNATANAFVAAIAQNAATGQTSLVYSTYLGGSGSDSGLSIAAAEPNELYVTGSTTSFDFPWVDNFQPFNGHGDAFVVKLDPTMGGASSLLYATPLAGTDSPGNSAMASGNAIAANGNGLAYLAGMTTAADFPRAGTAGNGFQLLCISCQSSPPASDAFVIAIQESDVASPSLSFTAPRMEFGQQTIGAQNIPPLFAGVTNTGNAPLTVTNLGIVGPNSSDFTLVLVEACTNAPILSGASCSFEVSFQPSVVGPEEASMAITDNAPGSPQVLQIGGIGGGPLAVPSPASQNFGNVPEGSSTGFVTMSLVNEGNENLTISNIATSGQGVAQFNVQDGTCLANSVILPQGSCSFEVSFAPTGTGSYSAAVVITDDSANVTGAQQVIPIMGAGVTPAPLANLLPAMLTFGEQAVGTTSASQIVTLTNVGGTILTVTGIAITGNDAPNFAILANTGNKPCPVAGGTLAIAAACTVTVNFTPQSGGAKNAVLSFADNAAGSPQSIAISGTGLSPLLQLSTTSLNFASQSVGTQSSQSVILTSTGNAPVGFNLISISGANAGDFSQTSTCFPAIGAPGNCTVSVTFNPTSAGSRSATLCISDNAMGSPQTVALMGTATAAGILVTPTSINFSSQLVGAASSPVAITIKNTGQGALVLGAISPNSFTGPNAGDFSETDNCSGSVPPSGTCAIQVTFTPSCANLPVMRSATLNLTDNAPVQSQRISLSGTATGSFCLAPQSGNSTSLTVTAGQTATYQLNVISVNGFTGTVNLSCTGAPPDSQSIITPTTETVAASSPIPFQVSVVTSANSATSSPSPPTPSLTRPNSVGPLERIIISGQYTSVLNSLAWLLLMALVLAWPRNQRVRMVSKGAGILLLAASLATCGGNATGNDPSSGTPAASYTMVVTATSTSNTGTSSLNLTMTVLQSAPPTIANPAIPRRRANSKRLN